MEDKDIYSLLLNKMKHDDMWFTTKNDPTYQEAPNYIKLDEYGEPIEEAMNKIVKEVKDYIGDGAVNEVEAVDLWICENMDISRIAYKDVLVTKFADKPVVDGIEAYENPVQLDESKKIESKPQWSGWDNISINNAAERQLLQFQLDKVYEVIYYTVDNNSFVHRGKMEVEVPSSAFSGNVTDKQVEEYIKKQLPEGVELDEISYKYYEDEQAMKKRIRQFLGKSKSQADKEEKDDEEISYLQDRILDYERKGRGTEQQYKKDLDRLHKLQGLDENKQVEKVEEAATVIVEICNKSKDLNEGVVDTDKYPTPTGEIVEYKLSNHKENPVWIEGYAATEDDKVYDVAGKVFMVGSHFGIDNSSISKLWVKDRNEDRIICNYDRGWDVRPTKENQQLIDAIRTLLVDFRDKNPYEVEEAVTEEPAPVEEIEEQKEIRTESISSDVYKCVGNTAGDDFWVGKEMPLSDWYKQVDEWEQEVGNSALSADGIDKNDDEFIKFAKDLYGFVLEKITEGCSKQVKN